MLTTGRLLSKNSNVGTLETGFTPYLYLNSDIFKTLEKHGKIVRNCLELEHSSLIFHQIEKKTNLSTILW